MSKKLLIIIFVLVTLVILGVVGFYIYISFMPKNLINSNELQNKRMLTPEEAIKKINTEYPELVTGIINFVEKEGKFRATITTDDGKVYTLWPFEPKSVYKSFGAEDGKRVEIKVKTLETGYIEWKLMKVI